LSDTTAGLKPLFDKSDGFISIACFERLTQRGKVLSLSFFRDEMAVAAWRSLESIGRTKAQVEAVSSRTIVCALRPPYATMGCSSASRNPGFVAGKSIVVAIGQQRTRHHGDSVLRFTYSRRRERDGAGNHSASPRTRRSVHPRSQRWLPFASEC
jgi:hypothetical protein